MDMDVGNMFWYGSAWKIIWNKLIFRERSKAVMVYNGYKLDEKSGITNRNNMH